MKKIFLIVSDISSYQVRQRVSDQAYDLVSRPMRKGVLSHAHSHISKRLAERLRPMTDTMNTIYTITRRDLWRKS